MKDTIAGQAVERKGLSTRSGIEIMRDLMHEFRQMGWELGFPAEKDPLMLEAERWVADQLELYPPHRRP
jgi:hypothetical protein